MAILNKDGTSFKLSGINFLAVNQQWLRDEELIFHNFVWADTTMPNRSVKPQQRTFGEIVVIPVVIPDKPKATLLPAPEPAPEPVPEPAPEPATTTKLVNLVTVHCLPLINRTSYRDQLYGDNYSKPVYGDKSSFEAIILERGDLNMLIWTATTLKSKSGNVDTRDYIKPGSILFPSHYQDGEKFRDYRWWKVEEVTPQEKGVVIKVVLTDIQPSFEVGKI